MLIQMQAIPAHAGVVRGWREVHLEECGEPLVAIGAGTPYADLMTYAVYAGQYDSPYRGTAAIPVANQTLYVRVSVAERLRHAQSLLPSGMRLVIFDAYRSFKVQEVLYRQFVDALREMKPEWSEHQIAVETDRYVAVPSQHAACPAPHITGGAVDVAIVQGDTMIEFGTPFDHGTERAALCYFEDDHCIQSESDQRAREHRRLLYHVMHAAGFEGFEHEWWHFNAPETQMGARIRCRPLATFGDGTPLLPPRSDEASSTSGQTPRLSAPIDRIAPTN